MNDVSSDRPPPDGGRDGACYVATEWFRSEQAFPVRGWSRWVLVVLSAAWLAGCGDEAVTPPQTPQTPVTGSIVGRVSADGEGLPGVTVSAGGATTPTGSTGAYRFDNLPGGTHEVSISGHPSGVDFPSTTASATISSAGQTVTIDFAGMYIRTSGITGTVSVGGSSAAGLDLTLEGTETKTAQTDDAGQYAFENLRAGSYVVRISFDAEEFSFDRTSAEVVLETGDSATVDFQGVSFAAERQTLIVLLDATGATWADTLGWSADRPVSEWGGVKTDSTGAVTGLELSGVGMEGKLPPELGKLTRLKVLNVSSNKLMGSIPKELGNLLKAGSLTELNLSGNALTGDLNRLFLKGDTSLVSPPDNIARAANADGTSADTIALTYFNAAGNRLTGAIPPEVGLAVGLEVFNVAGNRLSGEIPAELGNLSNLEVLNLEVNEELTGAIPPELGNLSNLEVLNLRNNELTGPIPPEIGRLTKLTELWLAGSNLSGAIPPELGNLSNLEELNLWVNELTGAIPPELGNLSNLEVLRLDANELTGAIPPELGNLSNLEVLDLATNELTGAIPPELGNLSNLEILDLATNELTGAIPPELGNLSNLEILGLAINELTGPIPPELGGLSNLTALAIDHNDGLSSVLPHSLVNLVNLVRFWFHETSLCAPNDDVFVTWLEAVEARSTGEYDTVLGPYCDRRTSEILLRDDFATRESLEDWTLGNNTSAGVDNGLLYLSNTEEGWTALAYHAFADGVSATDWRVAARIARPGGDNVRMIVWLFMDHDIYQHYRFEIGSGYDVDDRDTNYRFFAWNDNRDGPGEGGWVYFSDLGHGVSDAVNDGGSYDEVEFNEVDYSIIDGALSMNVNGTTVAGPAVLPRHLATDIVGIGLASAHASGGTYATTLFDWVELNGVLLGATAGGEVDGAHVPPEMADRIRSLEAHLAAGDVKEERIPRGSR